MRPPGVKIGDPFPDVSLTDLASGLHVKIRPLLVAPSLIFVWASW